MSSRASPLSRKQLPQYMPAAPAVIDRIRMAPATGCGLRAWIAGGSERRSGTSAIWPGARSLRSYRSILIRPRPEEELDDVALVRLTPVELCGRHRPQIEPIDVHGVEEPAAEALVARHRGADERGADRVEHLRLRALHDRREGKHELLLHHGGIRS